MVKMRSVGGQGRVVAPQVPNGLEVIDLRELIDSAGGESVHVVGDGELFDGETLDLVESVVENVSFTGCRLLDFDARDVVFRNCDFSGAVLPKRARLTRVRFEGTKARGLQANNASLFDVEFAEGILDQASFRFASLNRFRVSAVRAQEIDFYEANVQVGILCDSDLTSAEFSQASLNNVSFSGSTLDAIKGIASLRGATISQEQLLSLAPRLADELGIAVTD